MSKLKLLGLFLRLMAEQDDVRSYGNKGAKKGNQNSFFYVMKKVKRIDGVEQEYKFTRRAGDPGPTNDDRGANVTNERISHVGRVLSPYTPDFTHELRYGAQRSPSGPVYGDALAHLEYINAVMAEGWNAGRLSRHYEDKHIGEMKYDVNNKILRQANAVLMEKLKEGVQDPRLHAAIDRNIQLKAEFPIRDGHDRDGYRNISTELGAHASLVALAQHHQIQGLNPALGKGLTMQIGNSVSEPQMVSITTRVPEGYLGMTTTPGREGYLNLDTPPKEGIGFVTATAVGKQHPVHGHLVLATPEPVTAYAIEKGREPRIRPREHSPFHLKTEVE
jgi:hypothetical protein